MDSYCNINEAYLNNGILSNNCDLDKLARRINNEKRKKIKSVYRDCQKTSHDLNRGIVALDGLLQQRKNENNIDDATLLSLTANGKQSGGFYSAQGEYYQPKNMNGTLIKDICKSNESESDGITLDTPSEKKISSDPSLSSLSSLSLGTTDKKDQHHKCVEFDSIDSLESIESDENILNHIGSCRKCKVKVLDLIRKHKNDRHICTNISDSIRQKRNPKTNQNMDKLFSLHLPELKEVLAVCLIGFLVIIILDLIMRY